MLPLAGLASVKRVITIGSTSRSRHDTQTGQINLYSVVLAILEKALPNMGYSEAICIFCIRAKVISDEESNSLHPFNDKE